MERILPLLFLLSFCLVMNDTKQRREVDMTERAAP